MDVAWGSCLGIGPNYPLNIDHPRFLLQFP